MVTSFPNEWLDAVREKLVPVTNAHFELCRALNAEPRVGLCVAPVAMNIWSFAMTDKFKKNDKVEWKSSEGTIEGKVVRKLTKPIEIKGHHVAASEENPEILVKSDKTGAVAAHKPKSIKKIK